MTVSRREVLLASGTTALASGLTVAAAAPSEAATLPPTSYPLRLTDFTVRDPYVVVDAASKEYLLYATNDPARTGVAGAGTMVYRSRDLKSWSAPAVVFRPTSDLWARSGAWAPEVHRWRGRWYLFVTLHDKAKPLPQHQPNADFLPAQIPQHARGTVIAVADSLLGPFTVVDPTGPVAPATFMTLDGTLFKDPKGRPWMVYAHEWVQKLDGTIEAIPLKPDLSGADGGPIHLFKGSDATWIAEEIPSPSANQLPPYVTDGPQLMRLPGGALAMLWSTYEKTIDNTNGLVTGHYVVTSAVSPSGKLHGPWVQRRPLLRKDTGHGMVFRTLPAKGRPSRPLLVVHHGTRTPHAKLYEIELRRDGLRLGKHRKDLDGSK
ncbi:glycoside hydrolase family 43 protein [Amnibacterium kyonggiense]|uniref:Glycosyl hydrolase family 43 n=1 Tax=Amnibacterium kyonggiense TaxID=595671 RepID=A0A4R7FLC3_9MICO|nr:glycoside hydrolase family 43 protein [Amnibacterium kyonggiense]TDS77169.1 glycosyl hydrolase family 43 [Amnibacterium kyonggiense]